MTAPVCTRTLYLLLAAALWGCSGTVGTAILPKRAWTAAPSGTEERTAARIRPTQAVATVMEG